MNLINSTHSVNLPAGFAWVEELTATYIKVREEVTVTGALKRNISQAKTLPVTLQASNGTASISRAAVKTLKLMAEADEEMTLELSETESILVTFRHDPKPFEASPAFGYTNRRDAERWHVQIKLSTVASQ